MIRCVARFASESETRALTRPISKWSRARSEPTKDWLFLRVQGTLPRAEMCNPPGATTPQEPLVVTDLRRAGKKRTTSLSFFKELTIFSR
jgi:hypothetical protein